MLPELSLIGQDEFYVDWKLGPSFGPGQREMHGSCCANGLLYITGGRKLEDNQEILFQSDVWSLQAIDSLGQ